MSTLSEERVIELVKTSGMDTIIDDAYLDRGDWHKYVICFTDLLAQEATKAGSHDGWISVKDRLPDHENECLVYVCPASGECYVKTSCLNPARTAFYVDYDSPGEGPVETVTHWMPLPAAPKGE